ncbi:MAG: Ig-like domain-containing protein [Coriobacteriia bacterium]|nr:Ig-like domain-containing protein [Coriobacteriia bacterium]
MTKFVRNSRLRRVVSTMCAVAMLASLVVMPAGAAETGNVTSSVLAANFAATGGEYDRGVHGTLSVFTTGTAGVEAQQQSSESYDATGKAQTLGGGGLNALGVTFYEFYVTVDAGDLSGSFDPSFSYDTTTVPVVVSSSTTVQGVVNALDAALGALPWYWAGDVDFTSGGKIRVVKRYANDDAEIWVHSSSDPNDPTTDPIGQLSVAEAVMGQNLDPLYLGFSWGRYSPYNDTYQTGVTPDMESIAATWTPLHGAAIGGLGGAFDYGSFDGGIVDPDEFQSVPDTMTGQYTAVVSTSWSGGYVWLYTGSRYTPVGDGTSLVTFGNGVRDPAIEQSCDGGDGYKVLPSVTPTVGAVTTWTVDIDDPDSTAGNWDSNENDYNGVSVLFPKEFELVNGPNHAAWIADLAYSFGSTPTVETTNTAEGWLVTLSNFVDRQSADPDDGLTFNVALKAPTTAGAVGVGAKIWLHNVGTPWTANPAVTQLIDPRYSDSVRIFNGDSLPDGVADTDWVPVFCYCGPESMTVAPDVIKTVSLAADVNRAEGYTALVATAKDQFGNDVGGYATYSSPVISGLTDGAQVGNYSTGSWIWQYAKTPGVNTASILVDDTRTTTVNEALPVSVSNNTSGIGEPAKVVILPTAMTWADSSSPSFQIQLQDANGNPTSWLDEHSIDTDWFQLNAHSQNGLFQYGVGLSIVSRYIWRGWSKSAGSSGSGGSFFPGTGPNTSSSAWPTTFNFMTANGPDTWTVSAKHRSGSVMPAAFATVDITGEDPEVAGVPVGFKITADKKAPAAYADGDTFYNDKSDSYMDDAFGYAAAGGEDKIVLTARVVDAYGNTITNGTANIPVRFEIPKFDRVNAIMPTGHVYNTTTNAQGVATVEVKSFEPTLSRRNAPSPISTSSWFSPVRATTSVFFGSADWANPCGDTEAFEGYGFTYFHGASVEAALATTPEGDAKMIALADGVDTMGYNVTVTDSAFNTPIPNWDLKFTTSFGSFANGSQAVTVTTDAMGKASAPVKSANAGTAYLRVFDRWRNAFTTGVDFTDYATKFTVVEPTMRAGDRALAKVIAWAENIKTGQRVQWDDLNDVDFYSDNVYGYDVNNIHGDGVNVPQWTNDIVLDSDPMVDTDNNGKYDAVSFSIPAFDDSSITFESAGKRYALVGGSFELATWYNNVFYDEISVVAAPARPEVDFIKEATLMAEGTQLDSGLNLTGAGFTPAHVSDAVQIYLGDITTHGRNNSNYVGEAYVGRDGSLLPTGVFNGVGQMAPGEYDITVDGLVFKDGLVIKNLFNQAQIKIQNISARNGDQIYIAPGKNYNLNVEAYGAQNIEVWIGNLKLVQSASTGMFVIPTGRLSGGKHTITAKITWPTMRAAANGYYGGYTTVVKRDVYLQAPLRFQTPSLSTSGRTLRVSGTVSGPAEYNGTTQFKVKLTAQRLVNGRWSSVRSVWVTSNGASTNKFSGNIGVSSAGTYRVVVSHGDTPHPFSSRASGSRSVR